MTNPDHTCVGAISGSFGVRGEVRLKSFCAEPSDIGSYGPLSTEDGAQTYTITLTRPVKAGYAAMLSGVATKEDADALRGTRLYAPRSALPSLPDDEFYHADLVGLTVLDTGGEVIGTVASVANHGAGDILELSGPGLPSGLLIPFTLAVVPTVDIAAGRVIVDMPDGLIGGDKPDTSDTAPLGQDFD
ncbi:ribosome maturation factor RimM [Jannaschia sp. CCS1]|uniref:Ribosome maturation factor RimM n=1 Tax=Jannaschia sp. (strain CCS1) TaxID=290400 RepID=RIMM_JANSC|nr:ribosome maturation factor RimM [Jannaschia sp. CCS1]Q28UE7.1 RecName: Full=Ribosome maturation factor RimM [Jannaschia sp. CCS1]ABD53665.1 16S rRNA processing protein RimM [Jannaschia sp. CCS1]